MLVETVCTISTNIYHVRPIVLAMPIATIVFFGLCLVDVSGTIAIITFGLCLVAIAIRLIILSQ